MSFQSKTASFTGSGDYVDITWDEEYEHFRLEVGKHGADPQPVIVLSDATSAGVRVNCATPFVGDVDVFCIEVMATILSITVSPQDSTIDVGDTEQFTCIGHYDDDTTQEVEATWSVSPGAYASIDVNGLLTATNNGGVVVTAQFGPLSATANCTIEQPTALASRSTGSQGFVDVGNTPERTQTIPIPVPTDIGAGCRVTFSNQSAAYAATADGASVSSFNVSVYEGDAGTTEPLPTGSALATWTGQTIPGAGGIWESPTTFDATGHGTDGYLIVVIGSPANTHFNIALGITTGRYVDGTSVTDPVPGGMSAQNNATGTCRITGWETARPRIVVAGDSLVNAYSTPGSYAPYRYESAFVKIGPDNDWAVDTLGIAGSTLAQWYDGSRPNYFDGVVVGDALLLSNLTINSLPAWADLAAAQAQYAAFIAYAEGLGFTKIVLCTLPASVAYVANETLRQQVNTWLRTVPSGVLDVVDVAAIVDDPGTPSQLLPAYAQADGTHWNATGHAAVAVEITAVVGPLL